ncbi:hypothetical protein BJ912DRAFT_1023308 [Pholiota molesta]|nr:hypothetical protein BJ912DRAFT_1023308 [Pholiota molesta]
MALDKFLDLAQRYPDALSPSIIFKITSFLHYAPRFKTRLCETDEESVNMLWEYLKEVVWGYEEKAKIVEERFNSYGKELSIISLYPPSDYCTTGHCNRAERGFKLQKMDYAQGVLYTLDKGVRPVWAIRLQCEGCQTAYYHNYSVSNGMRYYYEGEPPMIIQVGEHQFVEERVINMWRADMHVSWCVLNNDLALSGTGCIPTGWPFKAALKGDHVQDGFTILSLLEDHRKRNSTLKVPHTGEQAHRFTEAIKARNVRVKLYGQQGFVTHRCQKCTRIYEGQDGNAPKSVWVAVMDGVTLGHPCCGFHNCKIPLTSSRDRFCIDHRGLSNICCIKDCSEPVLQGKRTCVDQSHQEIERIYILRGESRVQLQEKLKRQRVSHPNDGVAQEVNVLELLDDDEEEEFELRALDPDLVHGVKEGVSDPRGTSPPLTLEGSTTQKKRITARFGRKRTHNEQILVAPCGMILARETFFGAEAISTCAEFIKRTFRIDNQKPNHIFFDNNCMLAKHTKGDPFFKNIGLTVDVFHFNCKHSIKDTFCQSNCNPVIYPELLGTNGKAWYFNSSIAEQTNVWLGGFHSILREMGVDRYNFFLDQMILQRNKLTYEKLQRDGDIIFT